MPNKVSRHTGKISSSTMSNQEKFNYGNNVPYWDGLKSFNKKMNKWDLNQFQIEFNAFIYLGIKEVIHSSTWTIMVYFIKILIHSNNKIYSTDKDKNKKI